MSKFVLRFEKRNKKSISEHQCNKQSNNVENISRIEQGKKIVITISKIHI